MAIGVCRDSLGEALSSTVWDAWWYQRWGRGWGRIAKIWWDPGRRGNTAIKRGGVTIESEQRRAGGEGVGEIGHIAFR